MNKRTAAEQQTRWLLAAALMAAAAALGFYHLLLKPQHYQLAQLEQELTAAGLRQQEIQDFLHRYPDLEHYWTGLQEQEQLLTQLLPPEPALGLFWHELQAAAAASGVRINYFHPLQEEQQGPRGILNLEVSVSGSWPQLLTFLQNIEQGRRFVSITGSSLTAKEQQWEHKIPLKIFTYHHIIH